MRQCKLLLPVLICLSAVQTVAQQNTTKITRTADGKIRVAPEPNSEWQCFNAVITSEDLQEELNLEEEQIEALRQAEKQIRQKTQSIVERAREDRRNG